MAHFLRIAAIAQLSANNTAVNTFHYSADGGDVAFGTDDQIVGQANVAIGQLKDFYDDLCAAGLLFSWTIGNVVTEHQTGQPTKYVAATPQVAAAVGGSISALQLAGVISWRTGLAGKSYRGRSYIGPLRTSAFTFPDLANTIPPAFMAAGAALIAAPGVGELVPAVYSPLHDTTAMITSCVSSQACRTMRSRAA